MYEVFVMTRKNILISGDCQHLMQSHSKLVNMMICLAF